MIGKGIRFSFALFVFFCFPIVLLAGDRVEWTQSGPDLEKGTLIQLAIGHHSPPHLRLASGMTLLWAEQRNLGRDAVAVDVAVDSQGRVLITGHLRQERNGFYTFKLDSTGKTLWRRDYAIGRGGQAAGLALDPSQNAIVVGSPTTGVNPGFYTVKYDPNGTRLWERYYYIPTGEARGVATDSGSNVIVTGVSVLRDPDFYTLKYDYQGNLLWARREDIGRSDSARGIAVDGFGNIYIAGSVFNAIQQNSDFAVLKYNPQGQLLWKRSYDSGGDDRATNIASDRSGTIAITGSTKQEGRSLDFLTLKMDTTGNILWAQKTDGGAEETAYDLALDSQGRVIATGVSKQNSSSDSFLAAFSAKGESLWAYRYDTALQESYYGLALDAQDRMVFTGFAGADFRIMKCSDGFVASGEYRSLVQDFGKNIVIEELRAETTLFGQKITAIVETSQNNFQTLSESAKVELQEGNRSYAVNTLLRPAQYARVRFLFQTNDSRVTPELHQFALRGTASNR